ncbi:MAG: hypothetical protein IT307_18170 [Chloroflexi bacterium]|nr:hypothetical protein [Chloroflexota bacterium]
MSRATIAHLKRRLGLSLGLASIWVWGLLLIRMARDGLLPLEVWFGYGLSFLQTAVYAYLGILILALWRHEGSTGEGTAPPVADKPDRLRRFRPALNAIGLIGLATSLVSIAAWLLLRYPGPQAVPGTIASGVLVLMILAVVALSTYLARDAR